MSSNYLVMFLRFLTSASVSQGSELYSFYLEEGKTVEQFRRMDVENLDCDADNVYSLII
jgi:Peptidase C65 Otubain